MTPQSLVIVDTKYATPLNEAPYYELTAAPDLAADAPRTVLLTRATLHYALALDAEGTAQRFAITWRASRRASGRACLVIEQFEREAC
jgi:hypothetical protein